MFVNVAASPNESAPAGMDAHFAIGDPVNLYGAGSCIYAQEDRATSLYCIEFGSIRIYRLLADGRRQISAFHFAGETFGFEPSGTHQFFAEAVSAAGIRRIPLAHAVRDSARVNTG